MTYFDHLHTVADIKQEYRRLALLHHPDRPGGDTATMQAINAQYHAALERCDGQTSTGSDGNDHTYTYNADTEAAIMAKIAELIAAGVPRVADVYIIGTLGLDRGRDQADQGGAESPGLPLASQARLLVLASPPLPPPLQPAVALGWATWRLLRRQQDVADAEGTELAAVSRTPQGPARAAVRRALSQSLRQKGTPDDYSVPTDPR